jgi:hypothetical protein
VTETWSGRCREEQSAWLKISAGTMVSHERDAPDQAANATAFMQDDDAVDQLCALLDRCKDPAVVFEGTRIFVNIARSVASTDIAVLQKLGQKRIIKYLVRMVCDGKEYPVLLNEAVIALALLAQFGSSAGLVSGLLQGEAKDILQQQTSDLKKNVDTLMTILGRQPRVVIIGIG